MKRASEISAWPVNITLANKQHHYQHYVLFPIRLCSPALDVVRPGIYNRDSVSPPASLLFRLRSRHTSIDCLIARTNLVMTLNSSFSRALSRHFCICFFLFLYSKSCSPHCLRTFHTDTFFNCDNDVPSKFCFFLIVSSVQKSLVSHVDPDFWW